MLFFFACFVSLQSCSNSNSKPKENFLVDSFAIKWRADSNGCNGFRKNNVQLFNNFINKNIDSFIVIYGKPNKTKMVSESWYRCKNIYFYYLTCGYKEVEMEDGTFVTIEAEENWQLTVIVDSNNLISRIAAPIN